MAVSDDLADFIAAHVDDVESLELLLLLHRKRVPWTAEAAAAEVGLESTITGDRLAHLALVGVLAVEPGERFTWAPQRPKLASIVDELARAYRSDRQVVLDEISRGGTLRSFSDAFRLVGKKDENG